MDDKVIYFKGEFNKYLFLISKMNQLFSVTISLHKEKNLNRLKIVILNGSSKNIAMAKNFLKAFLCPQDSLCQIFDFDPLHNFIITKNIETIESFTGAYIQTAESSLFIYGVNKEILAQAVSFLEDMIYHIKNPDLFFKDLSPNSGQKTTKTKPIIHVSPVLEDQTVNLNTTCSVFNLDPSECVMVPEREASCYIVLPENFDVNMSPREFLVLDETQSSTEESMEVEESWVSKTAAPSGLQDGRNVINLLLSENEDNPEVKPKKKKKKKKKKLKNDNVHENDVIMVDASFSSDSLKAQSEPTNAASSLAPSLKNQVPTATTSSNNSTCKNSCNTLKNSYSLFKNSLLTSPPQTHQSLHPHHQSQVTTASPLAAANIASTCSTSTQKNELSSDFRNSLNVFSTSTPSYQKPNHQPIPSVETTKHVPNKVTTASSLASNNNQKKVTFTHCTNTSSDFRNSLNAFSTSTSSYYQPDPPIEATKHVQNTTASSLASSNKNVKSTNTQNNLPNNESSGDFRNLLNVFSNNTSNHQKANNQPNLSVEMAKHLQNPATTASTLASTNNIKNATSNHSTSTQNNLTSNASSSDFRNSLNTNCPQFSHQLILPVEKAVLFCSPSKQRTNTHQNQPVLRSTTRASSSNNHNNNPPSFAMLPKSNNHNDLQPSVSASNNHNTTTNNNNKTTTNNTITNNTTNNTITTNNNNCVLIDLVESTNNFTCKPANLPNTSHVSRRSADLRLIVVDGSNVAMNHGLNKRFSCKGIKLVVDFFTERGHKVTVFVPQWRRSSQNYKGPFSDLHILEELFSEGFLAFTPSRKVGNAIISSYDDRFILNLATDENGVVISNDQYQDLYEEACFRNTIQNRILQVTFIGDKVMFPDDPLGKNGPTLDQFLTKSWRDSAAPPPHSSSGWNGHGQRSATRGSRSSSRHYRRYHNT